MPTALVLDHFRDELKDYGTRLGKPIRIMLLAGADLIQTMVSEILEPLLSP